MVLQLIVSNADLFTSHSNRRALQTVADICQLSDTDQRLLGGGHGMSDMPSRYSAHTQQRVKIARLALQLCLESVPGKLIWEQVEAGLQDVSYEDTRREAARRIVEDEVVHSTARKDLHSGVPFQGRFQLKMRFASSVRTRSSEPQLPCKTGSSVSPQSQLRQEEESLLPQVRVRWLATLDRTGKSGFVGELVHLLRSADGEVEELYCKRRQKAGKAKAITAEIARGDLKSLASFASSRRSVCDRCLDSAPQQIAAMIDMQFAPCET